MHSWTYLLSEDSIQLSPTRLFLAWYPFLCCLVSCHNFMLIRGFMELLETITLHLTTTESSSLLLIWCHQPIICFHNHNHSQSWEVPCHYHFNNNAHRASFRLRVIVLFIPVSSPLYLWLSSVRITLTAPFRRMSALRYCCRFFTRGFLLILALCAMRPLFFIIVVLIARSPEYGVSKLANQVLLTWTLVKTTYLPLQPQVQGT